MMSIHPPQGVFITVIYRDPYGEWTDIEPEHFLLPCLDTKLFDFSFYEVWGKDCRGFSTQEFPNVASFAAVLVNDLGRQHVGGFSLDRASEEGGEVRGKGCFWHEACNDLLCYARLNLCFVYAVISGLGKPWFCWY